MIRVERALEGEPVALSSEDGRGKAELKRATEYYSAATQTKSFSFSAYKDGEVKAGLERLFHGKCAYCESFYAQTQPVDVEHYRPKGKVDGEGDAHRGYWWLAMDWENLLPSCIDCNRKRGQSVPDPAMDLVVLARQADRERTKTLSTGKATAFPLEVGSVRAAAPGDDVDGERRLLIDPTRDEPADHLDFHVERGAAAIALVFPKPVGEPGARSLPALSRNAEALEGEARTTNVSAMGAISIQIYGLNRLGLVQARTRVLRDLEFLVDLLEGVIELIIKLEERKDARALRMASVTDADERAWLEGDQDLTEFALGRLTQFRRETEARLKEMAAPKAPFSALTNTWIKSYLEG